MVSSQTTVLGVEQSNSLVQMTIRIPTDIFDKVLRKIKDLVIKEVAEKEEGQDVT